MRAPEPARYGCVARPPSRWRYSTMGSGSEPPPGPEWACARCASGPRSWEVDALSSRGPKAAPASPPGCRWGRPEMDRREAHSIRVAIADDHPIFRFGMRTLLEATPDTEVAGEAATGEEAAALADAVDVDVLLMDITMPGMGGIAATACIRDRHPQLAI